MDNNLFLTIGIEEQNNISQLSDCILHYYKTNVNENVENITKELLSLIDSDNSTGESMAKVEELRDSLLEIRIELSKDCIMFDQFMKMNEKNKNSVHDILSQIDNELTNRTNSLNDDYDVKALQKRYDDLKITTVVSEQMEQQLNLLIVNNKSSISSIENTVFTAITLWKNRLFLINQKKHYE